MKGFIDYIKLLINVSEVCTNGLNVNRNKKLIAFNLL